jgi:hypothetical protein
MTMVSSSVQRRPRRRRSVAHAAERRADGLGMTADTEVTILSDGADGPRSLGEAASTGPFIIYWTGFTLRYAFNTPLNVPAAGRPTPSATAGTGPSSPMRLNS